MPFAKPKHSVEIKVTYIPITHTYSVISKTVFPGKFSTTDTKSRAHLFFQNHTIPAAKESNLFSPCSSPSDFMMKTQLCGSY